MLLNLPKAVKPIGVRFLSGARAACVGVDVYPSHFASLLKECKSANTVHQIH